MNQLVKTGLKIILICCLQSSLSAQNINYLEYYIDNDPGYGNGVNVPITNGSTVSKSFQISFAPNSITEGIHYMGLRAKDDNDLWSVVAMSTLLKEKLYLNVPLSNIARLEYFIDEDPGYGNGESISFSPNSLVSKSDYLVTLPEDLAGGIHYLSIRAKDIKGNWSLVATQPIYKSQISVEDPLSNITYMEYFADNDPGYGNGTSVPFTPGTQLEDISFTASLSGLSNGEHRIFIRAKDAKNNWSLVGVRKVEICSNLYVSTLSPASDQMICEGDQVTFSVPAGYNYQWKLNDHDISGATQKSYNATTSGAYSVTVTSGSCELTTEAVKVTVNPIPSAPAIAASKSSICIGESVTLTSEDCNGEVGWSNGKRGAVIRVSPSVTTQYTAVCNELGCSGSISNKVTVTLRNDCHPVVVSPARAFICSGESVTLTASGCPGTITWDNGQTGASISVSPTCTSSYMATCAQGGVKNVVVNVDHVSLALNATDDITKGTVKFQAKENINSSAKVGTSSNPKPNVSYQAGNAIVLEPGFKVEAGAVFSATIKTCN